jgi:hypothetical protein
MDPVDRVLSAEDRLVPSSGFHSRVMAAVMTDEMRRSTTPFPWVRLALGVTTSLAWAAAGAWAAEQIDWSAFAPVATALALEPAVGYAAAAVAASLMIMAVPLLQGPRDSED